MKRIVLVLIAACGSSGPVAPAAPSAAPSSDRLAPAEPAVAPAPPRATSGCADLVVYPELWYAMDEITDPDERVFVERMVARKVSSLCDDDEALQRASPCLHAATSADEEAACIAGMGKQYPAYLVSILDKVRRISAEVIAKDGASCAKVAAEYHLPGRWYDPPRSQRAFGLTGSADLWLPEGLSPNRMRSMSASAQDALIERSKAAMTDACTREQWPLWARACIVAAGTQLWQRDCLAAIDGTTSGERRFTAPPLDLIATGVEACDEYLAAARALAGGAAGEPIDGAIAEAVAWAAENAGGPVDAADCSARGAALPAR